MEVPRRMVAAARSTSSTSSPLLEPPSESMSEPSLIGLGIRPKELHGVGVRGDVEVGVLL
jgi:hypothetical protein